MLVPRFEWTAEASGKNHGRIGWRWFVWHRFSHKNRTQGASRLQLHDSKRVVCASGIFDSHRPLHSQATQGDRIGVNTLIRWESLVNRRRGGCGLMASRNPALPLDSHVQSHAEVLKNKLCEFPRSRRTARDRRWLDSTPKLTVVTGRCPASEQE
jgi:hypothetical protein